MTRLNGLDTLDFELPSDAEPPLVLGLRIPYRGNPEGISRLVNLQVDTVDLHFFPEGGDLVAGTENRVAFKALDWRGKAQDIQGVVKDDMGEVVAGIEAYHQGMGAFSFTPTEGRVYHAEIEGSTGNMRYPLPAALLSTST